jgi:hypothetical protein
VNLTDLATVKKYVPNASTSSDNVLAMLVSSQSQGFLDLINRKNLESASYTETRSGLGSRFIQLENWPVTAVTSLQVDNTQYSASTSWNARGFQFTTLGKVSLVSGCFPRGMQNVVISYTAGYAPIPVVSELQTIPAATPFVIQPAFPNWRGDVGVSFFGGAALTYVNGPPAASQYFVTPLGNNYAGQYLFNATDAGKQVTLSYNYAGIPFDIVQAVNEMVLLRYRQRDRMDVNSMSIGGTVTSYAKEDYPKDVWRTIETYRRLFFTAGF